MILGTFLPVLGVVATVVLAAASRARVRWSVLVLLPALVALLRDRELAPVVWHDGNLLAAVVFMLYYVGLFLYYPTLLIVGGVAWVRRRRVEAT